MSRILQGRSAIITGANQGLGLAIARAFVAQGASVFLCARNAALLEQARVEQDAGARLEIYHQVEVLLLDDFAALPIESDRWYALVSPRVQGYIVTPIGVKIIPYLWLAEP